MSKLPPLGLDSFYTTTCTFHISIALQVNDQQAVNIYIYNKHTNINKLIYISFFWGRAVQAPTKIHKVPG